jgi:hypothetical protein
MQLLKGHISPETAYVVADYPYGFTLRCQIRYWLDFHPKRGFRFVSQTTNPKRANVWNKPKASTYRRFGAAMYLDDNGHVQWSGLDEYCNGAQAKQWADTYGDAVPEAGQDMLRRWVASKLAYDTARADDKAEGVIPPLHVGLVEARKAFCAPVTRDDKLRAIWRTTHADFKGKRDDGTRCILVLREGGTHSVPLESLTDAEINDKLPKENCNG